MAKTKAGVKQVPRRRATALLPLILIAVACTTSPAPPQESVPARSVAGSETPTARAQATGSPAPGAAPAVLGLPPAGEILMQQSGGGGTGNNCCTVGLRTATFTARGSWDLQWQYDCSQLGRPGNLSIDVFATDGTYIADPPSLNLLGNGGSGTQAYGRAGSFSLTIHSVCRWSVSAVTAARPTATPASSNSAPAATVAAGGASASSSALSAVTPLPASTASAQRAGGALQAIQPSIPTPRPAVSSALGAFAAPAARGSRALIGATAGTGAGTGAAAALPTNTPVPAVTPLRQATPAR